MDTTEDLFLEEEPPGTGNVPVAPLTVSLPPCPAGTSATEFRRRHFPAATEAEWSSWRWQIRHRITTLDALRRVCRLTSEEVNAVLLSRAALPLAITPYYASLLDPEGPAQALRRTVVPVVAEHLTCPGEAQDPLDEEGDSPLPGLVHRYPDRVLFLVTDFCSTHCRYCTRSRLVGRNSEGRPDRQRWQAGLDYIARHPEIRDVLVSGGDPLTLPDEQLDWLLGSLRRIPHLELLRLGTKVPAVLPQRITPGLVRVLRRHHPLWISIHFTHPDELTPETAAACGRLADAGIPLGSQTVLLAGINDELSVMRRLFQGLLRLRVRPYYLYQCDPILGSGHFRTPVARGLAIIEGLRGHTSGYAVPHYVIDAPGGGGKIPLLPETVIGREGQDLLIRNYEGRVFRYPDAGGSAPALTTSGVVQ
ncbi:MAG: KamA family radical SAM protein [Thermodesulfobacteriota bacterium]